MKRFIITFLSVLAVSLLLGFVILFECNTDTDSSLVSVDFVVSNNILEDGLSGGSLLVCETLDGSSDHGSIRRVGSRNLGLGDLLGSSSVSHFVLC